MNEILPLLQAESTQTVYDITQTPEQWYNHIRRYGTAVILEAAFGQRGATYDDPNITLFYEIMQDYGEIVALGATPPVDAFPFLRYIPGFLASYKPRAVAIGKKQRAYYTSLLDSSKARMYEPGTAPCFMHKLLDKGDKNSLTYDQLAYVGGVFVRCFRFHHYGLLTLFPQMEAGSESSSMNLHLFVLAMMAYPDTFRKAQQEIDKVCGTSASPTTEHMTKLPYLQAIMMEVSVSLPWLPQH